MFKNTSTYKNGFLLARESWNVVRTNKKIVMLPVINSILVFGLLSLFFWKFGLNSHYVHRALGQTYYSGWGLLAFIVAILITTVIGSIFGSGMLYASYRLLQGKSVSIGEIVHAVRMRIGAILGYAIFMATVGIVLQLVIQRLPFAGKIVS